MKVKFIYSVLFMLALISTSFSQGLKIDLGQSDKDSEKIVSRTAIIDLLEVGESYLINLESVGCFSSSKNKITISRTDEGFFAKLDDSTKLLTEQDVADIRGFEKELYSIRPGNCTSSDNYTLRYNNEVIRVSDNTCSWNGFYRLKKLMSNI